MEAFSSETTIKVFYVYTESETKFLNGSLIAVIEKKTLKRIKAHPVFIMYNF